MTYSHKPIPPRFTRSGWLHEQLARVGDVALFRRSKKDSGAPHFELVIITRHNGYSIAGNQIAPAEVYPAPEHWGSKGWTFTDEAAANRRFNHRVGQLL